ncbi:MAG TPA: NADH-quinone oxidoreductase subunit N [Thermomicrobiales bacterium]|nr:NADH-quinone oxidoreductase subunit N [Thermomicrobiales bacterium]
MTGGMEMTMGHDLALLAPEIVVVLTGIAALVAGMLRRPEWAPPVTVGGLLAAAALAARLFGSETTIFSGTYRVDSLAIWAKLILLPATAAAAMLAIPDIRGTDRAATVYSLLCLTTVGALALAGADDLLLLVLGVLISSLGSFALVAYPRDDRATEAAMKYFVFGAVSGAAMIFGLTYWFGAAGSTLFADLGRLAAAPVALVAGLTGVLVGLGYKAAIAPFHFWAPDAYDGGPVAVAAYLSIVPKVGAIFALAAVVRALPPAPVDWRLAVTMLAVVSMTYGNLAALPQTNVVRLLAYSSIAQAGYFLLGVVALGRSGLAAPSLIVFAAAYAAMNLGAFAVVLVIGRQLEDFAGVGRARSWLGVALVVFLLSLVGVPPLAGFAGKLLLFGAALDAGFGWLAVVAILNSVLSLAVYLRIIVPLYRAAPPPTPARAPDRAVVAVGTAALAATALIGIGAEALLRSIGP